MGSDLRTLRRDSNILHSCRGSSEARFLGGASRGGGPEGLREGPSRVPEI